MYSLQGFFQFPNLVDNAPDEVATFGELSAHAATFARDKTQHFHDDAPSTYLLSFHSVRDEDGEESAASVPDAIAESTLRVGQYLYNRAIDGQLSSTPQTVIDNLLQEFDGEISDFTMGELLTDDDNDLELPEWVQFQVTTDEEGGEDNQVTVWLADDSFIRQFTEYHLEIIPPLPVDDLDTFFEDPGVIRDALGEITLTDTMERVQTRRGEYPYSLIQSRAYDYVDPQDSDNTIKTNWIVLIYGEAGNNPDVIKNTIADYILDNSDHDREEWEEIFPDIFTVTEFIITPLWNQYAIPNRELQAGIYQHGVAPDKAAAAAMRTVRGPKYTDGYILQNLEISGVLWKSLSFVVVGNPENRDGVTSFFEQYPDYFLVSNNSGDFNRMDPDTQDFVMLLAEMLELAEDFTITSNVPVGMARLERDGVVYLTAYHDNINYLVVAKPNYLDRLSDEIDATRENYRLVHKDDIVEEGGE